jgi:hypothetical protein
VKIAMSGSSVLNVLAVVAAFAALTVSIIFAARQTRLMRQTNQMPIFVEMLQEFRSREFQKAERYIADDLGSQPSNKGVLGLSEKASWAITKMQSFFGTLGSLIIYDVIGEAEAVSTLGYRADRLWKKVEPYIEQERLLRGDDDYAKFWEDFVWRVRANWPPERHYGIRVHRLHAQPSDSGNTSQNPQQL